MSSDAGDPLEEKEHIQLRNGDLEPCVDCGIQTTGRDQGGPEGPVPRCSTCSTYDIVEDAIEDDRGLSRWSS